MDLSCLTPAEGSVKKRKRIGRGQGSGKGGTSTRGHKGAKARSGYKRKIGFEGGQMPLQRTSPKFGFTNRNRVEYKGINVSTLQYLVEKLNIDTIDNEVLITNGLVSRKDLIKILGNGDLKAKISVKAHAFSKTAMEKIEAVGGTIEKI
ncbi:MAG: 50S ribosomal protein L15 [Bacteroidales bacterium]|jgi:large subunit ribosomal protein L15|nr:50S ribosomal protein L15 [Bacteroidales bacterium]